MKEQKIHFIRVDEIDDSERGRTDMQDLQALAESIANFSEILPNTVGLIHPVLVDDNKKLIAGGRRLAAHKLLKRDVIATIFAGEVDELSLKELELEENIQRFSMTWQEEVMQIDSIHKIRTRDALNSHEEWGQKHTGKLLNLSQAHISNVTTVARCLLEGDVDIVNAKNMTEALNELLHRKELEANRLLIGQVAMVTPSMNSIEVIDLDDDFDTPTVGQGKRGPTESKMTELDLCYDLAKMFHQGDCIKVMKNFSDETFDHIVTDIPYGIEMDHLQVANLDLMRDTHDVKKNIELMYQFLPEAFRLIKPTGYLAFWYDLDHHEKLLKLGTDVGFKVQKWPLVWCKTHSCRNHQPQFNFTKATETCMIMRKGPKATLTKPQALNFIFADGAIERQLYDNPFAKPADCWNFILSAIAISGQSILDPFAGEMSCPRACINNGLSPVAIEIEPIHLLKGVEMMQSLITEMTQSSCSFINKPTIH